MEIPHRVWKKGGTEKPDNRHFMIMSYNVLAPMYCTDSRYSESHADILDWDHRKKMIWMRLHFIVRIYLFAGWNSHPPTSKNIPPALQKIGYDGHFQQKKREHAADGCAIFFLEARFSLMAVQAFAYNDQIPQDPASDLYQRLHPYPNMPWCVCSKQTGEEFEVQDCEYAFALGSRVCGYKALASCDFDGMA
ncbi:hypothetical protein BCR33DRAFT_820598 [Rhizoclosmatium globosum]|uniref:Uncharacterized protein n=1 Tax=Rhizoclosmatium globosum TaxID=329046 RepID=A0A1Y2ADI5_9FUNG|nr:hypothetical protein BCR33DRAFT_820598 [Rhizoclosmatium globosum]|eukprot:ORY20045.1 hypothetical protein BCR33DRAFT_820598 [Rhizoclosmatium globosum]